MSNEIEMFEFLSKERIEESLRIKPGLEISHKSGPIITGAYLHMLSELIGWPFAAIGLLIDNSIIREAKSISINLVTKNLPLRNEKEPARSDESMDEEKNESKASKDEEKSKNSRFETLPLAYLEFIDDGMAWTPDKFIDMISDFDEASDQEQYFNHSVSMPSSDKKEERKGEKSDDFTFQMIKKYSINLKIGGLRLGNTIVVYSKDSVHSYLGYLNIQKMANLHTPCNSSFLSVCWENSTGDYKTVDGETTRQFILSEIKDFVTMPELEKMHSDTGTKILIMNLKKMPICIKGLNKIIFEYELTSILDDETKELVDIHVRTLDNELKKRIEPNHLQSMIEFSLKSYLSVFFLEKLPTGTQRNYIDIYLHGSKVNIIDMKKLVEQIRDQEEKHFVEFIKPKMFEGLVGCKFEQKGIS